MKFDIFTVKVCRGTERQNAKMNSDGHYLDQQLAFSHIRCIYIFSELFPSNSGILILNFCVFQLAFPDFYKHSGDWSF